MGKRKRPLRVKMAPEAQQCFKGLSFFYIPNDNVNPAREHRITKAREHGVEWVRELKPATHVIVDSKFTYGDIEKILSGTPRSLQKIVVNESYPIDCISYRKLLNPKQDQYQVVGFPQESDIPLETPEPPQEPEQSLELKLKSHYRLRSGRVPPAATPPRSNDSTQRSSQSSSGRVITTSQLGSQGEETVLAHYDTETAAGVRYEGSQGKRQVEAPDATENDELSQCINEIRENPTVGILIGSDDEGADIRPSSASPALDSSPVGSGGSDNDDTAGSSSGRKRKRKRTSKKSSKDESGWQEKFACMKGGTKDGNKDDNNPNADTIAKLQEMCDWYTRNNDQWRIRAYRQAISALRREDTKITTAQEAREITGIGSRLADKIEEIVHTGRLTRLEEALKDPNHHVRELFLGIYDVGLSRAEKWIARGHKTLEDLLEKEDLSKNQRVGIEHYDDLNTRIPRAEVEALGKCVRQAAARIDPGVELLIGGSYRRGADSSGDIDFIITKRGTTSSAELIGFLDKLVQKLVDAGFLTVGLATSHSSDGSKWHGCCVLPKDSFPGDKAEYRPIWRRIDLLLVPETEFGAALLYFTGNDLFNRSMRLLARKKGMRLNQRGLYRDVMRGPGGVKYNEGELIEGRDEKKIFEALGVHWREPHQRWC